MNDLPSIDFQVSVIKINQSEWLLRNRCTVYKCDLKQLRKMFENYLEQDDPHEKTVADTLTEAVACHLIRNWNDQRYEVIVEALKLKLTEELEKNNIILPISTN